MKKTILNSVDEVANELGVSNVNSLNNPKYGNGFVQLFPQMSEGVAQKAIALCPQLLKITPEILDTVEKMYENTLHQNADSNNAAIYAYQTVIEACRESLRKENRSFEEEEKILSMMMVLADKISAKDTENKEWIRERHDKSTKIGFLSIGVVVGILGAVFFNVKNNPQERKNIPEGNNKRE